MSDNIQDIVIPLLRNIQAEFSGVKKDVSSLRDDVSMLKESVRRIDSRIATMESYMAGFHSSLRWQGDEMDHQRGRIETLEDRLRPDSPPEKTT